MEWIEVNPPQWCCRLSQNLPKCDTTYTTDIHLILWLTSDCGFLLFYEICYSRAAQSPHNRHRYAIVNICAWPNHRSQRKQHSKSTRVYSIFIVVRCVIKKRGAIKKRKTMPTSPESFMAKRTTSFYLRLQDTKLAVFDRKHVASAGPEQICEAKKRTPCDWRARTMLSSQWRIGSPPRARQ